MIKVSQDRMRAIEGAGYGLNGDIGGLQKNTYYTPDGRVIKTIPNMRERVKKKDGKVIWSGIVDANLDRGWLTQPPQIKKPYCPGCDCWHDTQEEVDECVATVNAKARKAEETARGEIAKESQDKNLEINALRTEVEELKLMLKQLLEKK